MDEYEVKNILNKYKDLKYEWDNWQRPSTTDNTWIPGKWGPDNTWFPVNEPPRKKDMAQEVYNHALEQRIAKIELTLAKIEEFLNKFFDTKIAG